MTNQQAHEGRAGHRFQARHQSKEGRRGRPYQRRRGLSGGSVLTALVGMIAGIGLGSYFTNHPIDGVDLALITGSTKEPSASKRLAPPSESTSLVYPQSSPTPHETRADKEPAPVEKQTQESIVTKNMLGQS